MTTTETTAWTTAYQPVAGGGAFAYEVRADADLGRYDMDDIAREGFHGHAAELAGLARCVGCPDCDASVAARFSGDDNEWLAAQAESLWEKMHLP